MNCTTCGNELQGRQTKFCSRFCKTLSTNFKNQNYSSQQSRGIERKRKLIDLAGGQCCDCGYNKNLAALEFHHLNPAEKNFGIDLRKCSNLQWDKLVDEVKKCVLICANCHRERHNPNMKINS